jgi:hypothetical protein
MSSRYFSARFHKANFEPIRRPSEIEDADDIAIAPTISDPWTVEELTEEPLPSFDPHPVYPTLGGNVEDDLCFSARDKHPRLDRRDAGVDMDYPRSFARNSTTSNGYENLPETSAKASAFRHVDSEYVRQNVRRDSDRKGARGHIGPSGPGIFRSYTMPMETFGGYSGQQYGPSRRVRKRSMTESGIRHTAQFGVR